MAKQLESMDAAYAVIKVRQIDERLSEIDAEKKSLTEKRKLYAPHLPKKSKS